MGYQHPGENGQWPHLDQLYGHDNIDLVCFDNYLPLSDWTTGDGGLDAQNWLDPAPSGAWPPTAATFNGLGLSGQPTIYSSRLSEGQYRGRRSISTGSTTTATISASGSIRTAPICACRCRKATGWRNRAIPMYAEPAASRATNNCAGGGTTAIRPSTTTATAPAGRRTAPTPNGSRNRSRSRSPNTALPACDKRHQPAERLLSIRQSARERDAVLVDLGPERRARRRLLAAPRRRAAAAGAAGGLRILGDRRQQRNLSRRRADDPDRIHVGVELGRAAVSDLPAAIGERVGRRRRLAGRQLRSAARDRSLRRSFPSDPPAPGPYCDFPAHADARLVGAASRRSFRPARRCTFPAASCARPRIGAALADRAELRSVAHGVAEHRAAGDRRLFRSSAQGEGASFYFEPPTLSPVTAQPLGTGDGTTTTFPFTVSVGDYSLTPATSARSVAIYLNGVTQAGGYTVNNDPRSRRP